MRPTPMPTMQSHYYSSAVSKAIVASRAQKRAGLVMLRPTNAIRRKRLVGISTPIGGRTGMQESAPLTKTTQIVPQSFRDNRLV